MFLLYADMKITANNALMNMGLSSQRKYVENFLTPNSNASVYTSVDNKKVESPFGNHLNFTGAINRLKLVKENPLESLFRDLIDFKGDNIEFAKHTFNKYKKHFGYEDLIADNLEIVSKEQNLGFGARFMFRTGEFQMNKRACLALSRCEIASVLRHEFEHFFQFGRMFRSEEIGIGKYLREESKNIVKSVEDEAYILGEEIPQNVRQRSIDSNLQDFSIMNMNFWNKIIDNKGILKKDTVEAKQAKKEFEDLMGYESYIDVTSLKKYSGLPRLQETIYYDAHGIGAADNYWNNPLEIEARKVEKSFLKTYLKFSKESYTPNNQIVWDQEKFKGIDELIKAFKEKFKNNHLPHRFKADVYDEIVSKFLKENSGDLYVIDCIKEASKEIRALTAEEISLKLLNFKKLIKKGDIRLYSKEETDNFMDWVNEFADKRKVENI